MGLNFLWSSDVIRCGMIPDNTIDFGRGYCIGFSLAIYSETESIGQSLLINMTLLQLYLS